MTEAFPLSWPEGWPRTPGDRRRSHSLFKTTFEKARQQMFGELNLLGAKSVILSTNLPLRLDGMPYSARRIIDDPGVAVYFLLRERRMVMARDAYWSIHDNLRSIGLAIAHLRGMERHGGAYMMERAFEGFAQLPPPKGKRPEPQAVDWRLELGPLPSGLDPGDLLVICESRYRKKAKDAHSDTGGDDTRMIRLNAAIERAREELSRGRS